MGGPGGPDGATHFLVTKGDERGHPHFLGTGEWVAPSNPQSATSELVRRSPGRSLPSTQTGSRRSRAHPGHLSRQSRSGNGPRLRPRHIQDGPCRSRASSERLHSGRGGAAESKIQPLFRDQSLAGQFGPLRQNVRAIPRAVLAWLAAHGFQPDLVCKSHWTAGKVGVRAHGAWGHEVFARDLGLSVFQCVAVPVVAQKSEMVAQKSEMVAQKSEMVAQKREMVAHKSEMVAQKSEM